MVITKRVFKRFIKKISRRKYDDSEFNLSSDSYDFMNKLNIVEYWCNACDEAYTKYPSRSDDNLYLEYRLNRFEKFINASNILC